MSVVGALKRGLVVWKTKAMNHPQKIMSQREQSRNSDLFFMVENNYEKSCLVDGRNESLRQAHSLSFRGLEHLADYAPLGGVMQEESTP